MSMKASNKNISFKRNAGKIKCLVWDLDNTLWNGILLENDNVKVKSRVKDIIKTLDSRGILQSIASKNEHSIAIDKLKEEKLDEYFLYPQINWNAKSHSVKTIANNLNIGLNSLAFIDDQEFEREEVKYTCPEVLCIDANQLHLVPAMQEMMPRFITDDSKIRRQLYRNEMKRKEAEEVGDFSNEEFLASLNMEMRIHKPEETDLKRAEELTERTNQLNTTGNTYSFDELHDLLESDNHILLISELKDKFGTYGKIGLALVEKNGDSWTIKLFLLSCRVMNRGVGNVLISFLLNLAKQNNVKLFAEFLPTDRNRIMYVSYKFTGFKEVGNKGDMIIMGHDLKQIAPYPEFIKLDTF